MLVEALTDVVEDNESLTVADGAVRELSHHKEECFDNSFAEVV